MLVTEKVLYMGEVGDLTINQIKETLFHRFCINLKQEILETDHHKQGLQNYGYFESEYATKISYNNKNITYQETSYELKERCGYILGLVPSVTCTAASNEVTKEETIFNAPTEREYLSWYETNNSNPEQDGYEKICKLAEYNKFFGVGEFPGMMITIIRIGNQDYYFGKLIR